MNSAAVLAIGIVVGAALAVGGLFRPFFGLLVFVIIHFVQPGELIPALAPLRIELVYGILVIIIICVREFSSRGLAVFKDRIFSGALLLICAGLLTVPFSVWRGGALTTVLGLVKLIILIFLMIAVVNSQKRLRLMLWCMASIACWLAVSSLVAFSNGEFYSLKNLDRAEGVNSIVGGPNELAGVLLALLPILVALVRTTRNIFLRVLLIISGLLSLSAIALTGSRIAMIGLVAVTIFYSIQSRHKVATFVVCLLIGVLTWQLLPNQYKTRYLTLGHYAEGGKLDASNELRLEIWKAGGKIFVGHPILGVGAGQFSTAYGLMHADHRAWMNPHNLLIQVACELGLVGTAVFFYFIWQIAQGIRFVLRKTRRRTRNLSYQTAIACVVMYLGTIILSFVGHTLYRPHWYLLAGLVAANRGTVVAAIRRHRRSDMAAAATQADPSHVVEPSSTHVPVGLLRPT